MTGTQRTLRDCSSPLLTLLTGDQMWSAKAQRAEFLKATLLYNRSVFFSHYCTTDQFREHPFQNVQGGYNEMSFYFFSKLLSKHPALGATRMERCPHTCAKLHLCILKKCLMWGLIIAEAGLNGHSHSTENSSVAPLSQELLLPLPYSLAKSTSAYRHISLNANVSCSLWLNLKSCWNISYSEELKSVLVFLFFRHIAKHLARHSRHTEVRCPISWQHGQLWYAVQGRNNFMKPTPTAVVLRAAFVQKDYWLCYQAIRVDAGSPT